MSISNLNALVADIAAAQVPPPMTTRIIGIDGCGGAGKSTLAERLATPLDARIIHTDDFASWDNPLNWYDRLLAQVLIPLSRNITGRYQRYDWHTRRLAEWHDVPVGGTVIVEGVTATRAVFRPMLSYTIFVETPQPMRLARGLERDGAQALELWRAWQKAEDDYLATERPADFANIVLDGTRTLP